MLSKYAFCINFPVARAASHPSVPTPWPCTVPPPVQPPLGPAVRLFILNPLNKQRNAPLTPKPPPWAPDPRDHSPRIRLLFVNWRDYRGTLRLVLFRLLSFRTGIINCTRQLIKTQRGHLERLFIIILFINLLFFLNYSILKWRFNLLKCIEHSIPSIHLPFSWKFLVTNGLMPQFRSLRVRFHALTFRKTNHKLT